MDALKKKILSDGQILPGDFLRVDGFLNHQIDIELLSECGKTWYECFKDSNVTKILTIESSGIAISCLTAQQFGVPVVYANKEKRSHMGDSIYSAKTVSYTQGKAYDIIVSRQYIAPHDRVLIIDDFLSRASDLKALISITEQAGATVIGAGVVIEKVSSGGGDCLRELGYRVESLAKIKSLDTGVIEFAD